MTTDQETRTEETISDEGKRELIKTAREYAAEGVYQAFAGYSKITATLISDKDLEYISDTIGIPTEALIALRERAGDVLPPWDDLTTEQQQRFAHSEEMDELGWLVLQAMRYAINPKLKEADEREAAEHRRSHDPLEALVDALAHSKGDLTIIRGRIR